MNNLVPKLNASASDEADDQYDGLSKYDLGFLAFAFMVLVSCYSIAFLAMIQVNRRMRPTPEERVKAKPASEDLIESQLIVREWNDGVDSAAVDNDSLDDGSGHQVQVDIQNHCLQEESLHATVSVTSGKPPDLDEETDDYSSSGVEGTLAECAICLAPYENGQQVCESNNMSCKHIFHSECMLSWLRKHNECPCCRKIFLLETV